MSRAAGRAWAGIAVIALVMSVVLLVPAGATGQVEGFAATPQAPCGPGSDPETAEQGRVPAADYASGRADRPYTCNAELVGHVPGTGGYKVHRYVDAAGRECAYFDSSLVFGIDLAAQLPTTGTGVVVLDMSDPANPVQTDNLLTPAMLSPHESLELNQARGLLAAVTGTPATFPGIVDVYDVTEDCRTPVLRSSSPIGIFGHESGFSPDGMTFYAAATALSTIAVIDLADPDSPQLLTVLDRQSHGIGVGDEGDRLYLTVLDQAENVLPPIPVGGPLLDYGIEILDSTRIQDRAADPGVEVISSLTWPGASIGQIAIPVTIDGRPHLVQVDEFVPFADFADNLSGTPGAARLIDIADETAPRVVSNLRLEVHDPAVRQGLRGDPGTLFPAQSYAGHYCAVPQREDPEIVACSMLLSGLRVFDIRDPAAPVEVAYFNAPADVQSPVNPQGAPFALSAPAFVPERGEVWYSDNASGFYAVRLTNGVWPSAGTPGGEAPEVEAPGGGTPGGEAPGGGTATPTPAVPEPVAQTAPGAGGGRALPATGSALPAVGLVLLAAAGVVGAAGRRRS